MTRCCNSACKQYKVPFHSLNGTYRAGLSKCLYCEVDIKWEGQYCPCCGHRLRKSPKNKKYKQMTRVAKGL